MTRLPSAPSQMDGAPVEEVVTPQRSLGWKRLLLWLVAFTLTLVLALLVFGAVVQSFIGHEQQLLGLLRTVQHWHAVGLAMQCAAVALVIWRWKNLVDWLAAKGIVQDFERERAMAFRGKAATFLLLYLILIPVGPHRIWLLLAG